jgi:hypothetical protein
MKSYKEYASKDWVKDQLSYITLKDVGNSLNYVLQLKDGALMLVSKAVSIEITTMPDKTSYVEGENNLDLTGMVVTLTRDDGSKEVIENYTYTETKTDSAITVVIEYIEFGQTFTETLEFSITPFDPAVQLVDFTYTANGDGTYTLTGWKQTLNGEASTEMIIPNNSLIVL